MFFLYLFFHLYLLFNVGLFDKVIMGFLHVNSGQHRFVPHVDWLIWISHQVICNDISVYHSCILVNISLFHKVIIGLLLL